YVEVDHRCKEFRHRLSQHQNVRVALLEQFDTTHVDGMQVAVDDDLPANRLDLDSGNLSEHGLDFLQNLGRIGLGRRAALLFGQYQHVVVELGRLLDPAQVCAAEATLEHHLTADRTDLQTRDVTEQRFQLAKLTVAVGLGHHHTHLFAGVVVEPDLHRGFAGLLGGYHDFLVLQHGGADDFHIAYRDALDPWRFQNANVAVVEHDCIGQLGGMTGTAQAQGAEDAEYALSFHDCPSKNFLYGG